jgi:hypothetical protein
MMYLINRFVYYKCGHVKNTRRVQKKEGKNYLEAVSAFLSFSDKKPRGKLKKKKKTPGAHIHLSLFLGKVSY